MYSKLFYKVYDYLADRTSDHTVANFSISSKKVIESFRNMREQNRFFPLFLQWMGYQTATIPIEHNERKEGKSSYNISKLVALATDADRKSTRLNSSHVAISYAVFCLK